MLLHFWTLCLNTAQKKIKHSENIFQSKFRNWSKLVKNRDFLKKVNRRYLKDGKKVSNLKLSHFSKLSYYWGWWNIPLITINHHRHFSLCGQKLLFLENFYDMSTNWSANGSGDISSPRGSAPYCWCPENPHKRGSTCRSSFEGRGATLSMSWYAVRTTWRRPEQWTLLKTTFIHTYTTKNPYIPICYNHQFYKIYLLFNFGIPNYKFNPSSPPFFLLLLLVFDSLKSNDRIVCIILFENRKKKARGRFRIFLFEITSI